jgi:hypothetical protein
MGSMLNTKNLHPQFLTDEAGKKVAVVISIEEFRELLEDIDDLAAIAERRSESTISHEELVKKLKKDGLL